jgi:hypothetical protein
MELQIIIKGTMIYRSFDDESKRNGFWFSLNSNDTYGYGSKTAEFRLSRDLKLINIINPLFYENLKKILVDVTSRDQSIEREHAPILFPLGFDNIVFYNNFAKKLIGVDTDLFQINPVIHTKSNLYFNNRSRLSIHACDVRLMMFLKSTLGADCDGISSLKEFPDIIRNGMHCREISLFDNSHLEYIRDIPRPVIGGSVIRSTDLLPPLKIDNIYLQKLRDSEQEFQEKMDKITTTYKPDIKFTVISVEDAIKRDNLNVQINYHIENIKPRRKTIKRRRDGCK